MQSTASICKICACIDQLLQVPGLQVNDRLENEKGQSALEIAIEIVRYRKKHQIFRLEELGACNATLQKLLRHPNIDVNATTCAGMPMLSLCIFNEDLDTFKALLQHPDIDINFLYETVATFKRCPLVDATGFFWSPSKTNFVNALLHHETINVNPDVGRHKSILKIFLLGCVSLTPRDAQETAAVLQVLQKLLDKGARQPNILFDIFLYQNNCFPDEVLPMLLKAGIDPNYVDASYSMPVFLRLFENGLFLDPFCFKTIKTLMLWPSTDVNVQDEDGHSALTLVLQNIFAQRCSNPCCFHHAKKAFQEHAHVLRALLSCPRMDVNLTDTRGMTPLHFVLQTQNFYAPCLHAMLQARKDFDLSVRDRDNKTVWDRFYSDAWLKPRALFQQSFWMLVFYKRSRRCF